MTLKSNSKQLWLQSRHEYSLKKPEWKNSPLKRLNLYVPWCHCYLSSLHVYVNFSHQMLIYSFSLFYRLSKVCSVTDTLKKLFLFVFFFPRFGIVCVATRLYRPWLNSAINDWKFCGLLIIHWTLAIINDQSTDYSLITHWFHCCHRLALSGNKDALK